MKTARIGVLAALGGAALVYGLASDGLSSHGARSVAAESAAAQPTTVGNFMLVDQNLQAHELYRMADKPAIVLITQMDGCPISRSQAPAYKELEQAYAGKGVQFLMLNSATQDTREAIQQEAKDAGFDMPILLDQNQLVGETLGVKRTAEVIVINPKTWQVVYHGPVDDRSDYGGGQKPVEHRYAADALDAVLAGKPVQQASLPAKGCLIDFPARAQPQKITYVHDVAPILEKNCVGCHEKGGIGPFAMDSYDRVKGFSPMIREVIMTTGCRPITPTRTWACSRTTGTSRRTRSRRSSTGWRMARRAARGPTRSPPTSTSPRTGRSESPTWCSTSRRSPSRRPAWWTTSTRGSSTR